MEIIIRPADLEDLAILLEFEQGVIAAERPFEPTLKQGHINYYDIKSLILSANADVFVATSEEEIIGSGYVKILPSKPFQQFEHHAYIGFMFVKPDHRGKGVSGQLMDEMLRWAKSRGLVEVRLDVFNDNAAAMKAYEKAGFKKHLVKMRLDIS